MTEPTTHPHTDPDPTRRTHPHPGAATDDLSTPDPSAPGPCAPDRTADPAPPGCDGRWLLYDGTADAALALASRVARDDPVGDMLCLGPDRVATLVLACCGGHLEVRPGDRLQRSGTGPHRWSVDRGRSAEPVPSRPAAPPVDPRPVLLSGPRTAAGPGQDCLVCDDPVGWGEVFWFGRLDDRYGVVHDEGCADTTVLSNPGARG